MKTSLVFFSFLISFISYSQTQGVAYTAVGKGVATTFLTDYHCLGINNSALGWGSGYEGKKITTGMTEFNFGIYSDSLSSDKLRKLYKAIRNDITGKEQDSAAWQEQRKFAEEYLRAGIAIDMNYNWLGFAVQTPTLGGFAVNIQENYSWYSQLNAQTSELVFQGKFAQYFDSLTIAIDGDTSRIANYDGISPDTLNAVILGTISSPLNLSAITKGSELRFQWNRYYNFGYGRKIFGNDSTFAVYGGVGGRFIQSMAMMSLESDGDNVYMYSSISPFYEIDYGAIANPSDLIKKGGIPQVVGNGYGVDLSASAVLFGKLKLALAVNNIGSVTYSRNVYKVRDSIVGDMSLEGLGNYNVTNSLDQLLEDGGILSLQAEEKYTVKNPATIRFGGSLKISDIAHVGIDVVAPFDAENPGSIVNPVYSIGGDIKPAEFVTISAGYYGGGIYKNNIPVGINFHFGGGAYEFGISSRDALSFFMKKSNSISTAFGFARVRF